MTLILKSHLLSRIWKFLAVVRLLQCARRIVVSREVFHVRPTDRCHSRGDQRDQILRNFATFAKIFKSLEFFWQLISYLAKCGAYFCKFDTLFGLIFIVANSQTLNINLTIWSHWRWFTPRSTRRNSPPPFTHPLQPRPRLGGDSNRSSTFLPSTTFSLWTTAAARTRTWSCKN